MIKARSPDAGGLPPLPQPLVFVTGNKNKAAEVAAILGDAVPGLESVALDLPELQGSLEDITLDKARRAASQVCPPPPLPSFRSREGR